ncbi:hypothetical protein SADUNF_Sadunf02G0136100 [Salix dunnii]|uniref:Uncharacterized protein n=1 Tax=Salix dunnii TaxID=1413687 RepID=A0A835N7R4_9ROSI|nr:hypothetical protein SADUNF_Sadunf02G0136100 [Salix dunnii]
MVSVNPNPAQGFRFFHPVNMGLPGLDSLPPPPPTTTAATPPYAATGTASGTCNNTVSTANNNHNNTVMSFSEDPNKKIRKPYTVTKSRESWTEQEHDKFLEALQLFDRDWKKIEAFVGSKTVKQIRSHAQKYFLKVQKSGTSEHVPPPRPKRKATHPYPQKAPKSAVVASQATGRFQSSSSLLEPGYLYRADTTDLGNPITSGASSTWSFNSGPPVSMSHMTPDDAGLAGPTTAYKCCYNSSNESTPETWQTGQIIDNKDKGKQERVQHENWTCLPHMSILVVFHMMLSWSSNSVESVLTVVGVRMKFCMWDLFLLMKGKRPFLPNGSEALFCIWTFMPDFAQVYSFIGSVFDPNASDHLQRLKQMDPINLETVLLLMRNLSINLTSPEFEDHRRLLASYDVDSGKENAGGSHSNSSVDNLGNPIPAM